MAEKKSILEEALLDINKIQEALNANTKEILRSVAKEEINGVVKESLMDVKEEEYEEEDLETSDSDSLDLDAVSGEDEMGAEAGAETLGGIEGSEEVGPEMGPELGMDTDVLGGDEIDMDMTASSDDEVIAIYKKLSGEDEIEIVGDEIHLNVSEPGEYVVKMNNNTAGATETDPMADLDLDGSEEEMGGEEANDVDYEIELGDETGEEEAGEEEMTDDSAMSDTGAEEAPEEEEEEEELDENLAHAKGYAGRQGQKMHGAAHLPEMVKEAQNAKKLVSETTVKYNNLLTEAKKLKAENLEFRSALKEFRTKLVETVVFNSNLTYVVRILQEHSTTKEEKREIINRFDNEATSLKESKNLYKSIVNQLETRKPITESIENKITKEVTTGSSQQLNESTAYVDPSTKRIIDLMKRVG